LRVLPFTAFVGLDDLKKALLVLAVDPSIGGLLIFGPKGTGKSSIVRAFSRLLPEVRVVEGCPFNCDPDSPEDMCSECRRRAEEGSLKARTERMRIVTLPIGATEDMVLGTINLERTLREGRVVFEPGLLGRANRNILYIDEVNLLPDHIVDAILDAAASGWHTVEREGVSYSHPARFILIGTMNPEEGELRPQLLDRFAVGVRLSTLRDPKLRMEIVRRNLEYESDPEGFEEAWRAEEDRLRRRIIEARRLLPAVRVDDRYYTLVAETCARLEVDGYRPDIVALKAARALAALDGRREVSEEDVLAGLQMALTHRTRAEGLKPPPGREEILAAFSESMGKGAAKKEAEARERREQIRFFPRWTF